MIFALFDYISYVRRTGSYKKGSGTGPMRAAWNEPLPKRVVEMLRPGSIIFVQRFNNVGSWLVMYMSQSDVSHVAVYIGEGMIVHSVPRRGVVKESIENLYHHDVAILPSVLPSFKMDDKSRTQLWLNDMIGRPYGMRIVIVKGIRIISGRDWWRFRWKFAFDIVSLLFFADLVMWGLSKTVSFYWITIIYLLLIVFNAYKHRKAPIPFLDATHGVPSDAFEFVRATDSGLLGCAMAIKDEVLSSGATIWRPKP